MSESTLHVVFSGSGYGHLRVALVKSGRKQEVAWLADCLSFGPIDTSSFEERQNWAEKELNIREDWVEEPTNAFWEKVLSGKQPLVLWTSRRSALEYSGFLECLWRLGDRPCSVIDLTDVPVMKLGRDGTLRKELAICLPYISEETIIRNEILDMAKPLSAEDRKNFHAVWRRLREENAAFRVVGPEGITSAPITHFDNQILSCVKQEWQKSARVVGEVMGKEDFNYLQTGDLVYFSRLQKLVETGRVESRGDMSKMRTGEVRLPVTVGKA